MTQFAAYSITVAPDVISNPVSDTEENKIAEPRIIQQLFNNLIENKRPLVKEDLPHVCVQNAGPKGKCIRAFKDAKVQFAQGIELAELYIKSDLDPNINVDDSPISVTCSVGYRVDASNKYHYLPCYVVSEKENYYYEFVFSNLDCNRDTTIEKSVFQSVCQLVRYTQHSDYYYESGECHGSVCETSLNPFLTKFGYTAKHAKNNTAVCSLGSVEMQENEIRDEIGLVQSGKWNGGPFRSFQLKFTPNVKFFLGEYVRNKMKKTQDEFMNLDFDCLSGVKHIDQKDGRLFSIVPVSGTKDDVLSCRIIDEEDEKWVDFIFDDLSESWKSYDDEGNAALNCYAQGGTYNGAACHGLNANECENAAKELKNKGYSGKTEFIDGICILKDAEAAQAMRTGTKVLIAGGELAVAISAAGAGGWLMVAVAVAATAATGVQTGIQIYQNFGADYIIEEAGKCQQLTDKQAKHDCAYNLLTYISGKDFDEWGLDSSKSGAVIDSVDKVIGYLIPERVSLPDTVDIECDDKITNCKIFGYLESQKGKDDISVTINTVATVVLMGTAVVGGGAGIQKLAKSASKISRLTSSITALKGDGAGLTNSQKFIRSLIISGNKIVRDRKNASVALNKQTGNVIKRGAQGVNNVLNKLSGANNFATGVDSGKDMAQSVLPPLEDVFDGSTLMGISTEAQDGLLQRGIPVLPSFAQ